MKRAKCVNPINGGNMDVIIDRFEGDKAVVEVKKGVFAHIDRVLLPNAKEGDVIRINVDRDATKKLSANIKNLADSLFED